jgi:hypothetical protein
MNLLFLQTWILHCMSNLEASYNLPLKFNELEAEKQAIYGTGQADVGRERELIWGTQETDKLRIGTNPTVSFARNILCFFALDDGVHALSGT